MPTTLNKEFQRIRPIPDGLLPNTEVFYLSSTNEVFLDYDDYFERMIQLNSSCWRCSVTGRSGLTYDEALNSENDAIKRRKKREETAKCKKATLSPTGASKAAAAEEAARKKRQIQEQQQQLEPLFRQAEKAGVEQMDRWRQSRRLLHEAHIGALREAIQAAKEAERKRQLERQRREREALAEWRKPRDDLLCEDLKPFPDFKALCWPDWVPREHYWDILAISSFCHSFAPLLIMDDQRMPVSAAFNVPQIATALVSRQINENSRFYRLLDTLLNTLRECIIQDDGNAADLTNPDHVGNEALKDFDHPMHGERIRQINRECQRQFKLHGASVWELSRDYLDLSEVVRLLLLTAGFYTKWRRQMRGQMHCYEDDGFIFAQQHPELVEHLEKFSVYSLNPTQRVQLITTFMDQLLSHSRFRQLIDQRIDELAELRKRLKQLKAGDLQHDKETRDALQHFQQQHKDQQKTEEELVDKDEQKTRAAVQRELALLRRAVAQLNEGRRIKDIGDLRERMLDAQRSLPWRAMADAREVHEFRSVQQNFYSDRKEELLREMYQLQGKMGMFLLGRDRAFRSYYYMNTAFIILCPRRDELAGGYCWGERTPKATTKAKATDSGTETEEEEEKQRSASRETEGQRQQHNGCKTEEGSREAEEGRKSAESGEEEEEKEMEVEDDRCSPPLAPLMACTGDGMEQCPVHNPPARWPRLLVYVERDGVRKLLDALNPRGFRESELAESISLYRDFYRQEMTSLFDSTDTVKTNWGAHLFGFGHGKPKELRETEPTELDLFVEVRRRLLDLEKLLHDRGLGSPHCSVDREEWRTMLENSQDTSMLCQGNCIPFIRSSTPPATALGTMPMPSSDHGTVVGDGAVEHDQQQQQMMYTREELSNPNLDHVQILGIALMQLVHGIRRDCFYNTFMMTIKKNNGTVLKRPTPSFMEWQKGLKACQSPSAVALFETTLEFAINWDFKAADGTTVSQQQKAKSGGRRRRMPRDGSAKTDDENTENENNASTSSAATAQKQQQRQHTRQREVNNLLVEAGFLGGMAIGARTRKPVTKYGDVEMDVDKLNFDEEEEEEDEDEHQQREENAEEMEEEYKEEQSDDEQQQQPDELLEDEEDEEGHGYGQRGTDEEEEEEDSDGMEYPRGREASTRTRKPVTKYGVAGLDELLNSGGEEGENDERFLDDDNSND
ncbi:hypothetical protein niasHT_004269 [Heterodera trifolii]|uniref:WAC domain-containing protein n=1 Tax=Heterodera trifolii TaxID=157864 RepID=A0ABD2LNE9_9BILA